MSKKPPSFVCPRCGAESFNPHDIRERYCGRCHRFAADGEARCLACGAEQPYGRIVCSECRKPLVFPTGARSYRDSTFPERPCDCCGELYRGPAVYCSLECAVADI